MLFIFDMGGVVTTTFRAAQITKSLGISFETFKMLSKDEKNDYKHLLNIGKITVEEFWQAFNENAKKTNQTFAPVEHDLFRMYFHPELNKETVKIIKALRKKHRVVCGTNTIQSHWENHLERGDYALFDQTYASNKIGAEKPDIDFYKIILEAENTLPENAFFTDDRLDNVKAAKTLGINAVQFTTAAELKKCWKKYF